MNFSDLFDCEREITSMISFRHWMSPLSRTNLFPTFFVCLWVVINKLHCLKKIDHSVHIYIYRENSILREKYIIIVA